MSTMSLDEVKKKIQGYSDFPKPGIFFYDIHPIMSDPAARAALLSHLVERYRGKLLLRLAPHQKIDKIVGVESRGYYFGIPLAAALNLPFVPFRKPGKLPGKIIEAAISTEYSQDTLCFQEGAIVKGDRVVIVDDLIATGGTALGAVTLVKSAEAEVVEFHCHVELVALNGKKRVGEVPFYSLFQY